MSRTYEALKKAEAERAKQQPFSLGEVVLDEPQMVLNGAEDNLARPERRKVRYDELPSIVQYQKLRVWLTNPASRGQKLQTVMVVGCRSGNGSTTTASLLAATLAEGKQKRVLIIDGNFRTPSLNLVFDVANEGGFTEVVSGEMPFEARIQPTSRDNLFVLTSGHISYCPADVFEGQALDQLVAWLKERFDFIIFDSAPACEFPDCYALAPKVDSIILVARAEETSIEDAQRARRNLEQAGGRLLGVVLNAERDYTPAFLRKFFSAAS